MTMRNGEHLAEKRNGSSRSARPGTRPQAFNPAAAALPPRPNSLSQIITSAVLERIAHDKALAPDGDLQPGPAPTSTNQAASALDFMPPPSTALEAPDLPTTAEPQSAQIPLWKRCLDCFLILATWPLWLPVMLAIMLGIKLSSPGPVFYRQERIGYHGRRFLITKFRTMRVNVETQLHESHLERLMEADVPMTKLDAQGDPRLIGCGRFLRAAGLDELPQLFNVLFGEMSLVGPRPCTVHEFGRYQPWQRERVNAPPGLTGYWQVNGKNKTTFSEMIAMDIFYGKNMSPALDLAILAKTVPAIVSQLLESRAATAWRASWKRERQTRSLANQ